MFIEAHHTHGNLVLLQYPTVRNTNRKCEISQDRLQFNKFTTSKNKRVSICLSVYYSIFKSNKALHGVRTNTHTHTHTNSLETLWQGFKELLTHWKNLVALICGTGPSFMCDSVWCSRVIAGDTPAECPYSTKVHNSTEQYKESQHVFPNGITYISYISPMETVYFTMAYSSWNHGLAVSSIARMIIYWIPTTAQALYYLSYLISSKLFYHYHLLQMR